MGYAFSVWRCQFYHIMSKRMMLWNGVWVLSASYNCEISLVFKINFHVNCDRPVTFHHCKHKIYWLMWQYWLLLGMVTCFLSLCFYLPVSWFAKFKINIDIITRVEFSFIFWCRIAWTYWCIGPYWTNFSHHWIRLSYLILTWSSAPNIVFQLYLSRFSLFLQYHWHQVCLLLCIPTFGFGWWLCSFTVYFELNNNNKFILLLNFNIEQNNLSLYAEFPKLKSHFYNLQHYLNQRLCVLSDSQIVVSLNWIFMIYFHYKLIFFFILILY